MSHEHVATPNTRVSVRPARSPSTRGSQFDCAPRQPFRYRRTHRHWFLIVCRERERASFGFTPHSGIATLTLLLNAALVRRDHDVKGAIEPGGIDADGAGGVGIPAVPGTERIWGINSDRSRRTWKTARPKSVSREPEFQSTVRPSSFWAVTATPPERWPHQKP